MMREKYSVAMLCQLLNVSRSGYYKWKQRQDKENRYERDRKLLTDLLRDAHKKHPSYGYHRLAISVTKETGWIFSHNLAHKCCKLAGIQSNARKYRKYRKPGEESIKFKNLVNHTKDLIGTNVPSPRAATNVTSRSSNAYTRFCM